MKNRFCIGILLTLGVALMAGCKTTPANPAGAAISDLCAVYTPVPVQVDGRLDDPIWTNAPVYPLQLSADTKEPGKKVIEPGTVRFAWDQDYFYMAVSFADSDVVAEGTNDGMHHYTMGDLAELFLWPDDQAWYLEMYVTPNSHYTTFFFPSGGRLLPSTFAANAFPLKVAAQVDGTLNDYTDHDRLWTGEMAVPVKELRARGAQWGAGAPWRVLVGRYNYSRWLFRQELTECPQLPATSFHLRENYGRLHLLAPGNTAVLK